MMRLPRTICLLLAAGLLLLPLPSRARQTLSGVSDGSVPPLDLPTPAAFWRLEEASGTRVDSTGNGHDLDANSGTPGNAAGILSNAISLASASSQEVHKVSDVGLHLTGDGTWACWVNGTNWNTTGTGNSGYPMYKGGDFTVNGGAEWDIHVSTTGVPTAAVWRGTAQFGALTSALSTSAWHLVAGRYTSSGTTVDISVDGAAWSGSSPVGGAANSTGTHQMTIGRLLVLGSSFMNGKVDAAGFWAVGFTNAQISNLYNAGVGREYFSGAWH